MSQELPNVGEGCKRCDQCAHWLSEDADRLSKRVVARRCEAIKPYWIIEAKATEGMIYPHRPVDEPLSGDIPPERAARIEAYEKVQADALRMAGAYVEDGSSYYAALRTQADFYCARFERRKP